jgi:large subunit ribosomal protein L40e
MISHIHQRIIVHFEIFNGSTHSLKLRPSDSIETAKEVLAEIENDSVDRLRLIFAGRQLEDGRTLSDYNIQAGCTISVIFRLRGC